ncbi:hypothetical protein Prum_071510 [Phytohabitans rumicis]|uniref:Uncharacterized protein n=1 Tax=Phytohabitans rumicis TaxID=1076125 RepID=A0A6V8LFW6_9ACTN|nr:hypothetical protein Prum_071510 [Phytohabitans rumicis]
MFEAACALRALAAAFGSTGVAPSSNIVSHSAQAVDSRTPSCHVVRGVVVDERGREYLSDPPRVEVSLKARPMMIQTVRVETLSSSPRSPEQLSPMAGILSGWGRAGCRRGVEGDW